MGDSADAASIMHQITAYGGRQDDAPFQQAFPQSLAFSSSLSNFEYEEIYEEFLKLAKATNLEDLRHVPFPTLAAENETLINNATYG